MDKYTKFILTMIAVGIIGINYHLFSGDIISKAEARHAGTITNSGDPNWGGPHPWRNHIWIENWPNSITCK